MCPSTAHPIRLSYSISTSLHASVFLERGFVHFWIFNTHNPFLYAQVKTPQLVFAVYQHCAETLGGAQFTLNSIDKTGRCSGSPRPSFSHMPTEHPCKLRHKTEPDCIYILTRKSVVCWPTWWTQLWWLGLAGNGGWKVSHKSWTRPGKRWPRTTQPACGWYDEFSFCSRGITLKGVMFRKDDMHCESRVTCRVTPEGLVEERLLADPIPRASQLGWSGWASQPQMPDSPTSCQHLGSHGPQSGQQPIKWLQAGQRSALF